MSSLFTFLHWRRKWQPTPVFLPGESQGWGSLMGSCLVARGLSGFLSSWCRGLRPRVESRPKPEDSYPVLTWILGYLWSLHRGVRPRLKRRHTRPLSSRAVAAVSRFPSRWHRDLLLSLQAFPQGYHTCHRGVSRYSAWKKRQCREIRFLWSGLRHLGDFWNGGTTPWVPLDIPVESASSWDATGTPGILFRRSKESYFLNQGSNQSPAM